MNRSSKYNDLEWAIGLHRCMLKIIGLWPQQSKNQHKEFFSKFRMLFNATAIVLILTIPALAQLIKVWGDMIQIIDNLQFTLPILVATLKVFIMWYKKRALLLLTNMIIKDWSRVKMDEERNVMLKNARITRLFAKSGILITVLAALSRISSVFFKQYFGHVRNLTNLERSLPIPAYYWYDIFSSPKYELTYFTQIIGMAGCGLTYIGVDNFFGLLILHVCGQMENLHLRLLHLGKDPDFKAVLKYNVKDHIRLIRSVEIIDDAFNLLLLGMIGYFCILFSLFGFLILTTVNQDTQLSIAQMSWYFSAGVSLLMHTCLYCAVGEHLVNQCEKIHSATYECIWYTLEPKAARNLAVIMVCAKKPLNITAGKIFPMTMSTFCSVSFVKHIKYGIILYLNHNIKCIF
ncbi:odorant receptor 43a-like isoform X2 [Solenopsis invicta]|uniref:odorant receptor 43a-like isoform X2 n=1 Tax=Solenopsis invicta TaxID=13686 RepID=UPI00193E237C|nr:odorant receptor 43a-like isoform X2 [Solenopsis invicta]